MKRILSIGLIFISSVSFAQEKSGEGGSFNLKEAQDYAIKNNYQNKKAVLDVEIAKKKVWETTAMG